MYYICCTRLDILLAQPQRIFYTTPPPILEPVHPSPLILSLSHNISPSHTRFLCAFCVSRLLMDDARILSIIYIDNTHIVRKRVHNLLHTQIPPVLVRTFVFRCIAVPNHKHESVPLRDLLPVPSVYVSYRNIYVFHTDAKQSHVVCSICFTTPSYNLVGEKSQRQRPRK